MVKVDLSGAEKFFTGAGPDYALAALCHETLAAKSGLGADFTGWLGLPQRVRELFRETLMQSSESGC